jgi:hypothetical protein
VNDAVNIIEISESLEHGMRNPGDNLDVDRTNALIDPIKGTLVHELHADANVRIGQERAVERYDIF